MEPITTVLTQDPWGGPALNTTTFGHDADGSGRMGPLTVHLDPELWEALGEPQTIRVTVEPQTSGGADG